MWSHSTIQFVTIPSSIPLPRSDSSPRGFQPREKRPQAVVCSSSVSRYTGATVPVPSRLLLVASSVLTRRSLWLVLARVDRYSFGVVRCFFSFFFFGGLRPRQFSLCPQCLVVDWLALFPSFPICRFSSRRLVHFLIVTSTLLKVRCCFFPLFVFLFLAYVSRFLSLLALSKVLMFFVLFVFLCF